jgi:uncharacterized membrane protein YdjX (TVP38/TMEM64 family)
VVRFVSAAGARPPGPDEAAREDATLETVPEVAALEAAARRRVRLAWVGRGLAIALLMLVPTLALQVPAVQRGVLTLAATLRDGGPTGLALYWAAAAAAGCVATPVVVFNGLAGYAFGPWRGLLVCLPAVVLHASAAFLVGRTMLRPLIRRRLRGSERWARLERALEADGLRIATLLRLTPLIPQNFLSFALSAAPLSFPRFALATSVGVAPIAALQCYVGSVVHDAALILASDAAPAEQLWVLAGSVVLSVLGVFGVTRVAGRALRRALSG